MVELAQCLPTDLSAVSIWFSDLPLWHHATHGYYATLKFPFRNERLSSSGRKCLCPWKLPESRESDSTQEHLWDSTCLVTIPYGNPTTFAVKWVKVMSLQLLRSFSGVLGPLLQPSFPSVPSFFPSPLQIQISREHSKRGLSCGFHQSWLPKGTQL